MNFLNEHILTILIALPLVGAAAVACMPYRRRLEIRIVSISFAAATLILSVKLLTSFSGSGDFEFQHAFSWIPALGISYRVGVDGVSVLMILLTAILTPMAVGASWTEISRRVKEFHALILVLEAGLIGTFAALDVFLFYVFWEAVLIPMYFIIGIWGTGNRIRSSIKFVIFTSLGSVIMLVGILYYGHAAGGTFDLISWLAHPLAPKVQLWLFAAFAFAFAVKIPIVPLHTWLPDAHTDAPTAGSVLLAGVLLKMGAYGLYRFAMPLFPAAVAAATPYFLALAVVGIIYGGLLALMQDDFKRLIAYSSVAHMGFVVLGFFALDYNSVQGAAMQMFNHGVTTGALFMMAGMLYGRTRTRMIADYGGSARPMPLLAAAFIFLAIASAGLPGLSTFAGEFLILLGSFQTKTYYALAATFGIVIAAAYMLWLVQRVFFGPTKGVSEKNPDDMGVREHILIVPIVALIIVMGVWPKPWLGVIDGSNRNFLTLSQRGTAIERAKPEQKPAPEPEFEPRPESPPPTADGEVTLPPLPPGIESGGTKEEAY
jgi:NADH-quinone oxidoreductase subunit M